MRERSKWYNKGFEEALAGLGADPPDFPHHVTHANYMRGFHDGETQAARDAAREDQESRGRREMGS